MTKAYAVLVGAFVAGIAATPVLFGLGDTPAFAAANANRSCLQNNRIWSWRVVNDRTMIVGDRQNRQFLVRLTSGCLGLRQEMTAVRFRTWTSLGCLENGDRVSFNAPVLGPMMCTVTDVAPYGDGQMRRYDYYDDRDNNGRFDRDEDSAAAPREDNSGRYDRNDPYRR